MGSFFNSIMLNAQMLQTDTGAVEFISNMDLGLLTTVLGLIIVFAILIIIALLLAIFSVLVKNRNKSVQTQQETAQIAMPAKASANTSSDHMDDKELVAVITAAIAASMNTSADTLVVRRIKRVGSWNKEAIEEQQNSIYY